MASLTITTSIEKTVTRQTLFNIWKDATMSTVIEDDLAPTFQDVVMGSSFSDAPASAVPGELFYHQGEKLMYGFHDVMDVLDGGTEGTGVSLWLAMGPDRFECACLAAEPIPPGAIVSPYFDRWVRICRPDMANPKGDLNLPIPMGVNQSGLPQIDLFHGEGHTTPSGAWCAVGIEGFVRGWFPRAEDSGATDSMLLVDNTVRTPHNWVGCNSGNDQKYRGCFAGLGNTRLKAGTEFDATVGLTTHAVTVPSQYTAAYYLIKWTGISSRYSA
jgi:hypothetical protein